MDDEIDEEERFTQEQALAVEPADLLVVTPGVVRIISRLI